MYNLRLCLLQKKKQKKCYLNLTVIIFNSDCVRNEQSNVFSIWVFFLMNNEGIIEHFTKDYMDFCIHWYTIDVYMVNLRWPGEIIDNIQIINPLKSGTLQNTGEILSHNAQPMINSINPENVSFAFFMHNLFY